MQSQYQDLTDSQWQFILVHLKNNSPRKLCLRSVVNAILWLTRTGTQWRNLDSKYPKWVSVYYYFNKWKKDGTILLIMNSLVKLNREKIGRSATPSLLAIDSQSIKASPFISIERGIDGNKKVNGRKRHIAVDSEGLPLAIYVGKANQHDGEAGLELLPMLEAQKLERLELIRADNAYGGVFKEGALWYNWEVDTTQMPPTEQGFVPQKNRWQVERSFGWLNFYRRLSKDYEKTPLAAMAFIALAFCSIILARIIDF